MLLLTLKRQDFEHIFCCWKTVQNIVWIRNLSRNGNRNRNQIFLNSEPEPEPTQIIMVPQRCWEDSRRLLFFGYYVVLFFYIILIHIYNKNLRGLYYMSYLL
jgi:hypothetical protein